MNKNLKKLIKKETYENMLIFVLRSTIIKPYLYIKKKTVQKQLSFRACPRIPSRKTVSVLRDPSTSLRMTSKKLFKLATYENILIAILRFLINRNPLSPLYALTKIVKRKLTKKKTCHSDPTSVIPSLSRNPFALKNQTQSDPCLPTRQASTPLHSARDDKKEDSSNKKTTVHNQLSFPRSRESLPCGQAGIRKANHRSCHSELVEESLRAKESNAKRSLSADKAGFDFAGDDKQTYHKLKHHFSSHHPYLSASSSILTYLLIIGGISFYLFTNYYTQANAWWNDDWHYRKSITINSSQVTADLTNFPMLVSITDAQLADKAQTDGDDIVFTENQGNKLDHEIESFDSSTGALVAWVRIPELDSDNDSQLFMYYGNPTVDNQQRAEEVWDENFKMVQHLEETGTGTRTDSTKNSNDGTPTNYDGDEAVTGKVDGADDLDGTNDYISLARRPVPSSGNAITFSAWIKYTVNPYGLINDGDGIIKSSNSNKGATLRFVDVGSSGYGNALDFYIGNGSGYIHFGGYAHSMTIDSWYYVTATYNGTEGKIFVNGSSIGSNTNVFVPDWGDESSDESLVNRFISDDEEEAFDGMIDEVRSSNIARSADWITTEYNNQNSPATFISLGAEERGNAPVLYLPFDEGFGTTAHDETSYRNDGTIMGATWKNEDDCRSGKCLEFDGTGDYVEIADDPSLSLKEELTLEAWVKPNNTNLNNQTIISKTETPNDPTKIYRSVGPSATSAITTGTTNALTIIGDRATFQTALPDNVGVGDVIQYDADNDNDIDASDSLAFVTERFSSLEYRVSNSSGGAPVPVNNDNNWSLFRSYTSLANAENGTENTGIDADLQNFDTWSGGKDLVISNEQWNITCYANGTTADSTVVTIDGWTTAADSYIRVYTPTDATEVGITQRHSGVWDDGKYRLEAPAGGIYLLTILDNYVRIDGLQVNKTVNDAPVISTGYLNGGSDYNIISNTIIKSDGVGSTGLRLYVTEGSRVFNNIIYNQSTGIIVWGKSTWDDSANLIYNNSVINCTTYGIRNNNAGTRAKNNLVNNCVADFSVGDTSFHADSDYNLSSDATAPGTNSKINQTVSFISTTAGSEDFHLSPTDTAAKDAGADLSGDSVFPFASDIDGQTRPAKGGFDIGADEAQATQIYRSVGPGKTDALETGDGNALTIVGGTATFQRALADNIGVGDVIQYDDDNDGDIDASDSLAFITGRISNFEFQISNSAGGVPTQVIGDNNWSLFRAYTSLYNAEAGTENTGIDADLRNFDTWTGGKDLVTSKEQWNIACYANGTTPDTTAVTVDNWTTGVQNFVKIYTPVSEDEVGVSQRHSGKWDNSKYRLEIATGSRNLYIYENYTVIDGLQITNSGTASTDRNIEIEAYRTYATVKNNIVKGGYYGIYSPPATESNGGYSIYNNIVYNSYSSGISVFHPYHIAVQSYVYNNIVYNCNVGSFDYRYGININDSDLTINNISMGNPSGTYKADFNASNQSYNISSDASAVGTGSLINQTLADIDFVSTTPGSEDLHILGTSVARNIGADLSADANLSFTTDIDGDTRLASSTTWDIGADEVTATKIYRSVGPGNTSALATDESHENTVSVTAGVATFSVGLADRIGVGDAVLIDTNADNAITSADTLLFIHGRNSSVSYDLRTHTGAMPADIAENDTYQIYRAYTSLANAENGIENTVIPVMTFNGGDRDLVTNNEEWNIACYGDAVDTTRVTVDGWNTGVENFIKIYTPKNASEVGLSHRHSGRWDEGKYKMEVDFGVTNGSVLYIKESFVQVDGIQISLAYDGAVWARGVFVAGLDMGDSDLRISNCIVRSNNDLSTGNSMHGIYISDTNVRASIWNNIVYDFSLSLSRAIVNNSSSASYVYNNTTYNSVYGIYNVAGAFHSKNNIVQNSTGGFYGTFDPSSDFNISDLASDAPGTHSKNSTTVTFRDSANDDFRLAMTDTAAKGAGLNLTYDSTLPITHDIEGEKRPSLISNFKFQISNYNWDIGADQISGTTHNNYSLTLNRDYPKTTFSTSENDQDNFSSGDINLEANTWSHLVYKRNADSEEMFINGSKKDSGTISNFLKTNGGKLYLGAENQNSKNSFKGLIDEIRIYNYARTENEVKKDTTAGSSGRAASRASEGVSVAIGDKSPTLSEGLVGYWKMDEASWNGTAGEVVDASGNENHGVAAGGASTTAGKFGSGGGFDGVDDVVDMGDVTSFERTDAFSVSAYFKTVDSGEQLIIGKDDPNSNHYGWQLSTYNNGRIHFFLNGSGAAWTNEAIDKESLKSYNDGEWHHTIVVYSGNSQRSGIDMYVDGVLQDTTSYAQTSISSSILVSAPLSIGLRKGSSGTNNIPFDGNLDEVRIYNRALSPAEVRELYEWAPGPVLHLKMDEKVAGDAQTLNDSSGNNYNGTSDDGANDSGMDCTVPGKFGSACQFDGVDDDVSMGDVTFLDGLQGFTVGYWMKTSVTDITNSPYPVGKAGSADVTFNFQLNNFEQFSFTVKNSAGVSAQTVASEITGLADMNWHYISGVYDGANIMVYVDGIKKASAAHSGANKNCIYPLTLGSRESAGLFFPGQIDDVRIYNYARTQKQILEDMNAGNSALKSPILDLDFNEGFGATAHDKSGNGNDGTLTPGAGGTNTTATMMWDKGGKFDGAMELDGTDDYVIINSTPFADNAQYSVSLWIKRDSIWDAGYVFEGNGRPYLYYQVSGQVNFASGNNTISGNIENLDIWNHLVGIYDGVSSKLYINGEFMNEVVDTKGANTSVIIGSDSEGPFDGFIDEVKIFNYALGEDEIKTLYNHSASMVMGGGGASADNNGTTVTGDNAKYCVPGDTAQCDKPVLELAMDEMTGGTAYDTSGNGNNGTINGATWEPVGKVGSALDFDGAGNQVTILDNSSLDISEYTYSFWAKGDVDGGVGTEINPIHKYTNYLFAWRHPTSGLAQGCVHRSGSWVGSGPYPDNFINNKWYYITCSYDGSSINLFVNGVLANSNSVAAPTVNTNNLLIGNGGGTEFPGTIDDVKIYNYARTPAQIAWDYNRGKPVAHWRFNEGEGVTVHDESGNGNHGTMTGATWQEEESCKVGKCLSFDGVDLTRSNTDVQDSMTEFTACTWFKANSLTNEDGDTDIYLISKLWYLNFNNSGQLYFRVSTDGTNANVRSSENISINQWYFVCGVWEGVGNNISLYMNGVDKGFSPWAGAGTQLGDSSYTVGLGAKYDNTSWGNLNGSMDEVKIWNYALTAEQIKNEYNGGAVNFR